MLGVRELANAQVFRAFIGHNLNGWVSLRYGLQRFP